MLHVARAHQRVRRPDIHGLATALLTELVANVAAADLVFPEATELATALHVNPHAMAVAVALAASTSFLRPMAYHTNAMVAGPGGYQPLDFLRLGLPLKLICSAAIVVGIAVAF